LLLLEFLVLRSNESGAIKISSLDCEKVAKDSAKKHGMKLVFILEQYDNGAWKEGDYVGHWMNMKEIKGKRYYIDMTYHRIFTSKKEVSEFWGDITSIDGKNRNNEVFIYGEDSIPTKIIWHYD